MRKSIDSLCVLSADQKMKVKDIPPAIIKYCIFLNDEECLCPEQFNHMQIGWFLNHSHAPNIEKNSEGCIVTLRDIKAEEEILIDYNHLNELEHLKEPCW